MAGITVGGLASGLDVNSIVEQLVAAERAPTEKRLDYKEAVYTAQISTYGTLKSALAKFQTSVRALSTASKFNARSATVSDDKVLTATASSIAEGGSYAIKVSQLAQSHSLASGAFASVTDVVGTGKLTIRLGTTEYDPDDGSYAGFQQKQGSSVITVDINAGNNSLEGVRDAINAADAGVQASIINDGSGYRLVVSSKETGADNSIRITVSDDDGSDTDGNGLSRLAYNDQATNLEQTMEALDAKLTVNGLAVTSSSNTVTGVVHGVTLNLKSVSESPINLSVARDKTSARSAIDAFVTAFNELNAILDTMGQYDPETKQAGVLQGDPLMRSVATQIRRALLPTDQTGLILADLGITTLAKDKVQDDGTTLLAGSLVIDEATLNKVMDERFDDIAKVFVAAGNTTDPDVRYTGVSGAAPSGRYGINITQLATQASLRGGAIGGDAGSIGIGGSNNSFSLLVDGVSSGTITLPEGTYTAAELAAEMQSRINGVKALKDKGLSVVVEFDGEGFVFKSGTYGSKSSIEMKTVGSELAAKLGLSVGVGSAGVDVAGTIGGVPAIGNGRTLTGTGAAGGISLEIGGTTTGSRGFVEFSRGMTENLISVLDSFLASDGLISEKLGALDDRMDELTEMRAALDERMSRTEARYRAQFTTLELLVSQLNTTGTFLAQQLEALPGFNKKD